MANLSITTAWNEAMEFFKREAGLILPVAFLLLALPQALLQIAMPAPPVPGARPEGGLWLLLVPLVIAASMIGSIAITWLALRPGASVGEALQVGLRRFIILFAASLLIAIAAAIVFVPTLMIVGGASTMNTGGDPAALTGSALLVLFIFMLAFIFLWIRLMLMTPVTSAEPLSPIGIIRRSWELTAGHFWKLLGFVILLFIVAIVISVVVRAIFGILLFALVGQPELGSLSMNLLTIVSALVQSVFGAIFATLLARIYVQLSGGNPERVFT